MSNNREIISYVIIIILAITLAQHMNVVVSGSMEPVFYRGDVVVIEQTTDVLGLHEINPANLKVGDIVIYHAIWFPEPVIHRIIATGTATNGSQYFITKGDNNPIHDPDPVYDNQIIAKVATIGNTPIVIPKVGYITIWIRGL